MVHARPIPGYNGTSSDEPEVNGHEEINLEARRRHRQEKQPAVDDDTEKILTIEQAQVDQPEEDQTEEQEADADHNDEQPQDQKPQTKGQKISKDHLRDICRIKASSASFSAMCFMIRNFLCNSRTWQFVVLVSISCIWADIFIADLNFFGSFSEIHSF